MRRQSIISIDRSTALVVRSDLQTPHSSYRGTIAVHVYTAVIVSFIPRLGVLGGAGPRLGRMVK